MSVDIDWAAITAGEDGRRLAEAVRSFVHDKFQEVHLPRFIRAVEVHGFDFGTTGPEIEIKDICDPLEDFYQDLEEDGDSEVDGADPAAELENAHALTGSEKAQTSQHGRGTEERHGSQTVAHAAGLQDSTSAAPETGSRGPPHAQRDHQRRLPSIDTARHQASNPVKDSAGDTVHEPASDASHRATPSTPAIPGGTTNLNYFHLPLGGGLSGTATPLAAFAPAHFHGAAWLENQHALTLPPLKEARDRSNHATAAGPAPSVDTSTSGADAASRPPSQGQPTQDPPPLSSPQTTKARYRERSPQDVQIVTRVRYSGDVRLSLTAELLIDYHPMDSFVGIPLKLGITGLSFDGVAVLAYIDRQAHFCFLSPEDAETLIGAQERELGEDGEDRSAEGSGGGGGDGEGGSKGAGSAGSRSRPVGGLLEDIRVESEIGDQGNGRQVLKNVGKIESFVLEQVRRIFEDEFVYPSFWTFLV